MFFTSVPIGGCWPSSGPGHQSLLRVNLALLLLGRCTSVHSWPGLPHQKRRRHHVLPYRKGRRGWFEHSLRHELHQKNRGRHQELEITCVLLSILFLVSRWSVSDIMSRGKSHWHLSPQSSFQTWTEWFLGGDLWARNAITYTTVTWDNIYYW